MMASMLSKIPFSFTVHTNYEMIIDGILMNQKFAAASFVVTISRFNITNYFLPRFNAADPSRIHLVRCGIDCDKYSPAPRHTGSPPVILSVGRLADNKGFHTLVSGCRILKELGIDAQCLIIGAGPEREKILKQIEAEGIADRVTLLGQLLADDVRSYLARADLFALPCCYSKSLEENGNHDGIPVALMEAMAMGVPTVSTSIGGIPELIQHGKTGLIVRPDDPEALAGAMAAIIQDSELASRLSRAGREIVEREFNIRRSAGQLYELFMRDAA
jgi:glycosyltransferase involved in cell wall biosynthesis